MFPHLTEGCTEIIEIQKDKRKVSLSIKTLEENSFDLDFMKLSANYQNWFYMNGNIVDVVIENNKMKKFLLDNKVEFENLSSEFIKKIK